MTHGDGLLHVFIDANVLLSFYEYTDDDLNTVRMVIEGFKQNRIQPYVNAQLSDEVRRNRDLKLKSALEKLKDQRLDLRFPALCTGISELDELKEIQRSYSKKHQELLNNVHEQIRSRSLLADKVIEEFFTCGAVSEISDNVICRARRRADLNNPPRKSSSIGDPVHWEWLLDAVPETNDLHIISGDGHFASDLDATLINAFLELEWSEKKKSTAILYKNLGAFLRTKLSEFKLPTDFKKRSLIDRLRDSSNFSNSHSAVAGLSKLPSLSSSDVEEILRICLENTQVRWILTDIDIEEFIDYLLTFYEHEIDEELVKELQETREAMRREGADWHSFDEE